MSFRRMQFSSVFDTVAKVQSFVTPGPIGANSVVEYDLEVVGTELGDIVFLSPTAATADAEDLTFVAFALPDKVRVRLINATNGAIDPGTIGATIIVSKLDPDEVENPTAVLVV